MSDLKKPAEPAVPATLDVARELMKRAAKGDASTLPLIRMMLKDPKFIDYFGGNLARCAETSFVKAIAGEDLAVRESVYAKLAALRKELLGESPTPVEVLLVERVVACWLQVQDADIRYAQGQASMTFRQGDFNQRRMDAAHRRYLAALKALALVRKLAIPALQINLARKQVNVVAPAVVATATL